MQRWSERGKLKAGVGEPLLPGSPPDDYFDLKPSKARATLSLLFLWGYPCDRSHLSMPHAGGWYHFKWLVCCFPLKPKSESLQQMEVHVLHRIQHEASATLEVCPGSSSCFGPLLACEAACGFPEYSVGPRSLHTSAPVWFLACFRASLWPSRGTKRISGLLVRLAVSKGFASSLPTPWKTILCISLGERFLSFTKPPIWFGGPKFSLPSPPRLGFPPFFFPKKEAKTSAPFRQRRRPPAPAREVTLGEESREEILALVAELRRGEGLAGA